MDNNKAEMALLGSMILDPDAIPQATAILKAENFYRMDHQRIFQAIVNIFERNDSIDLVLLRDELQRIGKLDDVGDVDYTVRLSESVPSSANTKYYAEIVREMAIRRAYISAGSYLAKQGYDNTVSIAELSNEADEIIHIADQIAPDLVSLDTVPTEAVHWLWFNRIPIGKLSIIAGDPGLGKSFLSLSIAAYVSAGIPWPDLPNEPNPTGKVILLSAEDDISDTIKPRLEAMSADCRNILVLEAVQDLSADIAKIEQALKKTEGIRLVVIDPISAYIGTKIDDHSNTEIRAILKPLAELASKYRVAILAITHLNKGGPNNPIYRVMGSLAWAAAARTVWAVFKEEEPDPLCKTYRRLFLCVKNNLASDAGSGMAFTIMDGRLVWETSPIQTTAAEYLRTQYETNQRGPQQTARVEALEWLHDVLSDGPIWSDELQNQADKAGINWKTLNRAKGEPNSNVISEQVWLDGTNRWQWRLNGEAKSDE